MPFARFMELALYCPEYGYYEKIQDKIGRSGDYYTSVSVGELFGSLLASQFVAWHASLVEQPLVLVEAGAHDGQLAADILEFLRREHPEVFSDTTYVIVEPSSARQNRQAEKLIGFSNTVRWVKDLEQLGSNYDGGIRGIVFCNELLDALPFRRLKWNQERDRWVELGVGLSNGTFEWRALEQTTLPFQGVFHDPGSVPSDFARAVPDGFVYDECVGALEWWRACAQMLKSGWMLAFDYGFTWEEFFERPPSPGTLRSYRKHQLIHDVLKSPGEQDITGHINFGELEAIGKSSGLKTVALDYQSRFLTQIAARSLDRSDRWGDKQRRQFQTLTHPGHLGAPFRVLVQSRNCDV